MVVGLPLLFSCVAVKSSVKRAGTTAQIEVLGQHRDGRKHCTRNILTAVGSIGDDTEYVKLQRGDILVIVDVLSFSPRQPSPLCMLEAPFIPAPLRKMPQHLPSTSEVRRPVLAMMCPNEGAFRSPLRPIFTSNLARRASWEPPNGATCSRYASQVPFLFAGALVNAKAVATVVSSLLEQKALSVTVIACGERWKTPSEDGELRVALEDYLGAGAILSYLPQEKSPEARVCEGAFVHVRDELHAMLWECGSGRELGNKDLGWKSSTLHT